MMDLKMEVYSPSLVLLGMLEVWESTIWEEKAFGAGSFSVKAIVTAESVELLSRDNIVWIEGETAGIIEYINGKTEESGLFIIAKGRLLTGLLDRRILWGRYSLNNTVPEIMRYLVNDCCINPTRGDTEARKMPGLIISDIPSGGDKIRYQKTGGSLLDALAELGEAYQVAFGVRFNPAIPQMEFWARYGQNLTTSQTTNEPVFYSTELDDVLSSEYTYDSGDYKNVALVGGEGEGDDRTYVTVEDEAYTPPEPPAPIEPTQYTVTLLVDPEGGGVASGGKTVTEGTSITVTATPSNGFEFVEWRENGAVVSTNRTYSFMVSSNRTLTAVFAATIPVYAVVTSIDPDGSGTTSGAGSYREGQTVTVTATPGDGYKFVAWQENGQTVSEDAEYNFAATSNRALVAVFVEIPSSRLPEGYTKVEYIQSDNKCGINTGCTANFSATRIVMDIEADKYVSGGYNEYFFNTQYEGNKYFAIWRTNENVARYVYNTNALVEIYKSLSGQRMTIDWNFPSSELYVGNTMYTTNKANSETGTNIYLLSGYGSDICAKVKLYSVQLYSNGTIQRDFVPCINPDGTAGLYDLIGKQFYMNAWSGTFTPGPTV